VAGGVNEIGCPILCRPTPNAPLCSIADQAGLLTLKISRVALPPCRVYVIRGRAMLFELFHLSLAERQDLFVRRQGGGASYDRESWLRELLSARIEFIHRTEHFCYVPVDAPKHIEEPLIFGRIGRQVLSDENAPPDEGFEDVVRDAWKASVLIIDPRKHSDGQKAAFQCRPGVGSPFSILKSFLMHVSTAIEDAPFFIEAKHITDPSGFWDFVRQHDGEITSITLEFVAPNMFGIGDDYDKEWEELKANEKALRVKNQIESEYGLNPCTPRVEKAVEYASKGGGEISAKTRSGKKFNSKSKVKKISVPHKANGKKRTMGDLIRDAVDAIFRK